MKTYPASLEFGAFPGEANRKKQADQVINANCASVKVLFDKITLQRGTWTADEQPPATSKKTEWAAFKLNELGYFAGPVGKVDTDQLKRAAWRYSFQHPQMDITTKHDDGGLTGKLTAGDEPRKLTEEDDALTWEPGTSRKDTSQVMIDHDLYVYQRKDDPPEGNSPKQGEAARVDGLQWLEALRLDRWEVPLEVAVYLKNAKGEGVLVPEALPGLEVRWVVEDTEENCPRDRGGARDPNAPNAIHFRADDTSLPPFKSSAKEDEVRTEIFAAKDEDTPSAHKRYGKAGILFRGSYNGGDTFTVRAELALGAEDLKHLRAEHSGWDDRMVAKTAKLTIWRRLHVTGDLVWGPSDPASVDWPKVTEAYEPAFLKMVPPPNTDTPFWNFGTLSKPNYKTVFQNYYDNAKQSGQLVRVAYTVVDPTDESDTPPDSPLTLENDPITLVRTVEGKKYVDWRVNGFLTGATSKQFARVIARVPGQCVWVSFKDAQSSSDRFQVGEYLLVADSPGEGGKRAAKVASVDSLPTGMATHDNGSTFIDVYSKGTKSDAEHVALTDQDGIKSSFKTPSFSWWPMFAMAEAIHRHRPDKRPGIVIVRAVMSPDVLPASKKVALVQEGFSMGQDRGVVVLDAIHYHDYSAVFLVAHEVGHDLYLTHPFEVGEDHSHAECLMNYPKNMLGKGGKGKALPDFCEKCQKKLRGWTIRSTLTDSDD